MGEEHSLWDPFPESLRKWIRSGAPRTNAGDEVERFLHGLAKWITAGTISVDHENQGAFNSLEKKYPIGFNRIDWRGVRNHRFVDVLELEPSQEIDFNAQVERLVPIRDLLGDLVSDAMTTPAQDVIWIGDDYDIKLTMDVSTLLESYVILFTTPQHSYVVPEGYEWCLNYTMEGYLYFGFARDATVTGPVDLDDEE